MTEPNPFFRWLYRLLALGGLCLLLAIAYVFVASEMSSGRLQSRDTVIAQKNHCRWKKKKKKSCALVIWKRFEVHPHA